MRKGVKFIYFILFKLKYFGDSMIIKIYILLEFLELRIFLVKGVSCWKWMSYRVWKIDSRNQRQQEDVQNFDDEDVLKLSCIGFF